MFSFLAPAALKLMFGRALTNAKSDIAMIPPKVKLALLIAAAALIMFLLHQHIAHKALQARYDAGFADGHARAQAEQKVAQATAAARSERINSQVRKQSDEKDRHIVADADDLRLRGPGKAVCSGVAAAPGGAGGRVAASRPADASVDQVPDPERPPLIALPFAGTIAFAEQCDRNRNEALSWREADRRQKEAP
jgi:hypothetical protein